MSIPTIYMIYFEIMYEFKWRIRREEIFKKKKNHHNINDHARIVLQRIL